MGMHRMRKHVPGICTPAKSPCATCSVTDAKREGEAKAREHCELMGMAFYGYDSKWSVRVGCTECGKVHCRRLSSLLMSQHARCPGCYKKKRYAAGICGRSAALQQHAILANYVWPQRNTHLPSHAAAACGR
jgi:hypothetical protein